MDQKAYQTDIHATSALGNKDVLRRFFGSPRAGSRRDQSFAEILPLGNVQRQVTGLPCSSFLAGSDTWDPNMPKPITSGKQFNSAVNYLQKQFNSKRMPFNNSKHAETAKLQNNSVWKGNNN